MNSEQLPASTEEAPEAASQPVKTLCRIRLTYARREALRYVSHLDMQLVWERTLRRAGMALAYTQGFNPRPRLHLACALPLGFTSLCEMTDFWLDLPSENPAGSPSPDLAALLGKVQSAAPPGLQILRGEIVPLNLPALQTLVRSAEFLACPLDPVEPARLERAVRDLLAANALPRVRRGKPGAPGKPYDLRPLIESLQVQDSACPSGPALWMRLVAREGATGRPEEVIDALGLDPFAFRVERVLLVLD